VRERRVPTRPLLPRGRASHRAAPVARTALRHPRTRAPIPGAHRGPAEGGGSGGDGRPARARLARQRARAAQRDRARVAGRERGADRRLRAGRADRDGAALRRSPARLLRKRARPARTPRAPGRRRRRARREPPNPPAAAARGRPVRAHAAPRARPPDGAP
jgi:hypothetical protein